MEIIIRKENDVWTGVLIGRLDTVQAEQAGRDMQPLMEHAEEKIVLDCTGLEYISSSGLRLFLTLRKKVAEEGGSMVITHINDEIRNVFTITGFFKLFDIR